MSEKPAEIDVSNEPLAVRTLYPNEEFWTSSDDKREAKRSLIEERVTQDHDVVLVHDTDADGLGTAVMVRSEHPDAALVPRGHNETIGVGEVGRFLADHLNQDGNRVIITDNGCDGDIETYIDPYLDTFDEVFVYDHHQWPDGTESYLDANEVQFVIDENRCATRIVHDEYVSNPSETLTEFALVTEDHDLWIKEDKRSDALADYSYAADMLTYVEMGVQHGVAFLKQDEVRQTLLEERETKQEEISHALRRAEFYELNDEITFAITYGECPQSDTGSVLYGEYGADVVCMMFPDGGLSFRSDDNGYALPLAREFNGGGHKNAAGAYLKETVVEGDVPYERYWATMGQCLHDEMLRRARDALDLD